MMKKFVLALACLASLSAPALARATDGPLVNRDEADPATLEGYGTPGTGSYSPCIVWRYVIRNGVRTRVCAY